MRRRPTGVAVAVLGGLVTLVGVAGLAMPAVGAGDLALPTSIPGRHNALVRRMNRLGQLGAIENRAPGPVTVTDEVALGLRPDGSTGPVTVRQRLVVQGTGDYILELPMDAADVAPVGTETGSPGLRQGTVLWEGFSPGRRELAGEITVRGAAAAARVPMAVTSTANGGAVTLTITNTTGLRAPAAAGDPDPASLAAALDATRAVLRSGALPTAGAAGVPESLGAAGPVTVKDFDVSVPLHLSGEVRFGGRTQTVDTTLGGATAGAPGGDGRLVLTGRGPVRARLTATLVAPRPDDVPVLASDAGPVAVRAALETLDGVLLRALRITDYAPIVPGVVSSTSAATFAIASAPAARPVSTPSARHANIPVLVAMGVGLVLLLALGARVWARH